MGGGGGERWGVVDSVVVYFTGDSFSRNSRRLGSRLRRGSSVVVDWPLPLLEVPQNQPIGSMGEVMLFVVLMSVVIIGVGLYLP